MGSCIDEDVVDPDGVARSSPGIRAASSAYQRKNSAAYPTSPRASGSDLPFSSEMSSAKLLGVLGHQGEPIGAGFRTVSRAGVARQPGKAAAAASTARGGRWRRRHPAPRPRHRPWRDRGPECRRPVPTRRR